MRSLFSAVGFLLSASGTFGGGAFGSGTFGGGTGAANLCELCVVI